MIETKERVRRPIAARWVGPSLRSMQRNIWGPTQRRTQLAFGNQRGAMDGKITAIIGGVITLVIGMVLASTVNSQAATLGSATNIGSFTGAQAIGDLIPLVYIAAILLIGVGLIAAGGAGYVGRGPMGR